MRRAIRALLACPGFSAVAVVTLALGLGVNAAIFSLTRTVLLRPLPYRDADRLVHVGKASPARAESYSGVVALAAVAAVLAGVCVAAAAIPAYRAARGGLELSTTICHGSTS